MIGFDKKTTAAILDRDRGCSFSGCERDFYAKDLCATHYQQHLAGRELTPIRRYTRRGAPIRERIARYTMRSEGCWEWAAQHSSDGYAVLTVDHRPHHVHRLVYEIEHGSLPPDLFVDHICHNRGCVRPDHLQAVTNKQNMENLAGLLKNNTSGYRGVSRVGRSNRWLAYITHNGKQMKLGRFGTPEEAAECARQARMELFSNNLIDRSHDGNRI